MGAVQANHTFSLLKLCKSQVPWEGDFDVFLAGNSISLALYLTNIYTHGLRDCPV